MNKERYTVYRIPLSVKQEDQYTSYGLQDTNSGRQLIKLGLERVSACLNYLGNPQNKFKSILIGGTNGKGSTTFYLSNLACKFTNYRIGRYISPHLISWDERFVINEKPVSSLNRISKEVRKLIKEFENKNKELDKLTEFEIYTITAFYLFAKENVDIAFLEVGLGGRLDATNIVDSKNILCSIITNVSMDHMDYLGYSVENIAYEKAGIIKNNNFIITGASGIALKVIEEQARELKSTLILIDNKNNGSYIDKDIEIALKAWDIISNQTETTFRELNKKEFLQSLQFPGRFQFIESKKILLDGAHNPDAAIELKRLIEKKFKTKKLIYIIGMLDKDYKTFIRNLIPNNSYVICTEPKSERATKKETIAQFLYENGSTTDISINLRQAITKAKSKEHDVIIITGSLYLVGEALQLINDNQSPKINIKTK